MCLSHRCSFVHSNIQVLPCCVKVVSIAINSGGDNYSYLQKYRRNAYPVFARRSNNVAGGGNDDDDDDEFINDNRCLPLKCHAKRHAIWACSRELKIGLHRPKGFDSFQRRVE